MTSFMCNWTDTMIYFLCAFTLAVTLIQSTRAQECAQGYYGQNCSSECRKECINRTCQVSQDTGSATCTLGCKDRWRGDNCELRCPRNCLKCDANSCAACEDSEWFGKQCDEPCTHCSDLKCHRDGTCVNGCGLGKHGRSCSYRCSPGCKGDNCSIADGLCTEGCKPGWTGPSCTVKKRFGSTKSEVTAQWTAYSDMPRNTTDRVDLSVTTGGNQIPGRDQQFTINRYVIVLGAVLAGFLFLLLCVTISIWSREREKSKSALRKTHPKKPRQGQQSAEEPIYDEIQECDMSHAWTTGCKSGTSVGVYLTPHFNSRYALPRQEEDPDGYLLPF